MRVFLWIAVAGCIDYNTKSGVEGGPSGEPPPEPGEVADGFALEEFGPDVEGVDPGTNGGTEDFHGAEGTTVDVIVFGDTSGSMEDELKTLGETITPFIERLAEQVEDWTLAAVTDGSGCTASGVLTPDTPNFAKKFADALVRPIGNDDEGEMGLRNVAEVVERTGRGDCNEGLVRGGSLQIVFVSDENEESPGYDESPGYWQDYVTQIEEAHGDPSRVKMSAVAGPTPQGCLGADPGFGYDFAVAATGGEYLSICEDWASQIDIIADHVGLRSTFPLADDAIEGTVRVWVNEVELADTAFSYDPRSNVVTLDTAVGADAKVTIEYELET